MRWLWISLLVLSACGPQGGEDQRTTTYVGSIVSPNGEPMNEVQAYLFETGESATTDADGAFILESFTHLPSVGIFLQKNGFSNTMTVEGIPTDESEIHLAIAYDEVQQSASLKGVSFGEPPPEPTPTDLDPDVTPTPGKPNEDSGAVSRGRNVWNSVCASCHFREKTGRSASQVRRALRTQPDMQSLSLSSQQIADVVAYLNRGKR